jgi:hypothetical protein
VILVLNIIIAAYLFRNRERLFDTAIPTSVTRIDPFVVWRPTAVKSSLWGVFLANFLASS